MLRALAKSAPPEGPLVVRPTWRGYSRRGGSHGGYRYVNWRRRGRGGEDPGYQVLPLPQGKQPRWRTCWAMGWRCSPRAPTGTGDAILRRLIAAVAGAAKLVDLQGCPVHQDLLAKPEKNPLLAALLPTVAQARVLSPLSHRPPDRALEMALYLTLSGRATASQALAACRDMLGRRGAEASTGHAEGWRRVSNKAQTGKGVDWRWLRPAYTPRCWGRRARCGAFHHRSPGRRISGFLQFPGFPVAPLTRRRTPPVDFSTAITWSAMNKLSRSPPPEEGRCAHQVNAWAKSE